MIPLTLAPQPNLGDPLWRREVTSVVEPSEQLEHQRDVVEEKPEEHADGHGRTFLEVHQAAEKLGWAASQELSSKEKDSTMDKSREQSDSLVNQELPKTAVLPPHQHR